jgi:hypothetical protein
LRGIIEERRIQQMMRNFSTCSSGIATKKIETIKKTVSKEESPDVAPSLRFSHSSVARLSAYSVSETSRRATKSGWAPFAALRR